MLPSPLTSDPRIHQPSRRHPQDLENVIPDVMVREGGIQLLEIRVVDVLENLGARQSIAAPLLREITHFGRSSVHQVLSCLISILSATSRDANSLKATSVVTSLG